ncbi:MAG TPA: Trk family potassium uptake protein [Oribacterium sp.]|nr:Trk family potassium uptake protein [Oribacterium sp.]
MFFSKWIPIRISSFQLILLSFFCVILSGGLFLSLPIASVSGETSFLDAMFTAVSAVCVTGLVVHDTASHWTPFGKAIILILIQIGGLGVITISIWFSLITGKKINLFQRITMQDAIGAGQIGGIVRFTKFMLYAAFTIEGIGALLLCPVMITQYGFLRGIMHAVFYAVSAFCNAGFDLSGTFSGPYSSLTAYAALPYLNIVIMSLIILGGLGFGCLLDLLEKKAKWTQYRLQTKLVLITTLCLILIPALYFFFVDFQGYNLTERFCLSFFQSVTARTAGFNTANLQAMTSGGITLLMVLMLIGGSPGSTAGGFKTTTLAVLLLTMQHSLRGNDQITASNRTIETSAIYNAISLVMCYLMLLFVGGFLISGIEHLPMVDTMFECASALGTVGLTRGITPFLHPASKLILMGFMYFGRVGALTIFYAAPSFYRTKSFCQYPKEGLMIG